MSFSKDFAKWNLSNYVNLEVTVGSFVRVKCLSYFVCQLITWSDEMSQTTTEKKNNENLQNFSSLFSLFI